MIVNFCPTGMVPTKAMTPYVPIEPSEIVDQVLAACERGITIVHLHARDELGLPTWRPEVYEKIVGPIRSSSDVVICVSTSGRAEQDIEKRAAVLDVDGIDMASLTLGSWNGPTSAVINEPADIVTLAERMQARGIMPECEAFGFGMVNYLHYLIRKGVMQPTGYVNLLVGGVATAQVSALDSLVSSVPAGYAAGVAGIGSQHQSAIRWAVANGYGVRVGLEDCWTLDGRLVTNQDLLQRATAGEIAMSPSQFRAMLQPGEVTE